ncbi:rhomboid family intramembrane serine protease [uncultured Tyzzerella sp.]|uniref:rhomboid family intramembrane serine protease n=1 Tax=uncultured Tyzzerella sp. TaxID=2321398 RepID=UPI002943F1E8|nr:rhomboid family intramembrane serine protease [uncultured Tyzzerella sp.]
MNLIFLSNFDKYLLNNDFFKIENKTSNNDIYFKNIGTNGYLIIPMLNDTPKYTDIFSVIEQNANYLLKRFNLNKIFLVKILVGEHFLNDDLDYLNCELNLDNKVINIVWGVNLITKKLIIKSNQPTKLLNIEKYINLSIDNNVKNIKCKNKKYILSKNTYFTYALVFVITLIHIVIGISTIFNRDYIIYKYGVSPSILKDKEYYRLITFLFIHSDLTHLISNILSLYIFGTRMEKYLGKTIFLLTFILGGLFSGIFSTIFTKNYSVGASGAIFAIESAILYFSTKEKITLDGLDYYTIAIFSIVSILISFPIPNIDNAGHIGGFLMGIIICFLYYNLYYKRIKNSRLY